MSDFVLHATISGRGETLVMLHGYMASGHYFKHIRERLESDYRVVTLDLLGFGRSPKPKVGYTYDDHVSAIHHTIETLGIAKPYVLLGHSMGALIALRFATEHGDDLKKLLLFNPPLFTDATQMITEHKVTGRRYRIMLYSKGRHAYWLTLRLLPRNKSSRRPAISFTDIVSMSPAAREGSYRHVIGGANVFQDLRKVTVPTLLVNGHYDRAVYLENLASKDVPSNVTVETLETGHHPLVRNVELCERTIRSYLLQ